MQHHVLGGFSVRTQDFRYTEWRAWNGSALKAVWEGPAVELELYNHTGHYADVEHPFDWPQINLAADASLAPDVALLHTLLVQQFN